jgi:hypothetical protein
VGREKRGGRRPRSIPAGVPISSSGRWGRRRVRVGQCATIFAAELVYDKLIREGVVFGPGWCSVLAWTPKSSSDTCWEIDVEVIANAVWRRGRLFFRCANCRRRATRLYIPIAGLEPRCRQCWYLSYESQSWSYKPIRMFGRLIGPIAYATTIERRKRRRQSAVLRYKERRAVL